MSRLVSGSHFLVLVATTMVVLAVSVSPLAAVQKLKRLADATAEKPND